MLNTYANTNSNAKLTNDVADPEQRHLLVDAQIRNGLPLQLRAMREDRGWTQAVLAEKLRTTQNTVSRLENPKTSKPTITTLKRIAEAFDVALIVKFAPFSEFINSVSGMSRKSIAVPSHDKDAQEVADEQEAPLAITKASVMSSLVNESMPNWVCMDYTSPTNLETMRTLFLVPKEPKVPMLPRSDQRKDMDVAYLPIESTSPELLSGT